MKATIPNMRDRVDHAIMHIGASLRSMECERNNPQIEELFQRLSGRLEAYNAVLDALNGRPALLAIEYRNPLAVFDQLDGTKRT